ncbi:TlpA disulfide reductase family protein [uncultured Algibacter sp.]|uniref:TlpA family protein disulfide reductase n=1 Tax=uncultured Algibacter sp. TaxID=298659 RepID=UPI00260FB4B9|nr:TlpA disulfide reductase family protein [uncultured Algibacter sp.]
MKKPFKVIFLIFCIGFIIPNVFSQWRYPNYKNINDDVIITYEVKYDRDLSEKEKQSIRFKREIVVIFNKDKLLQKTFTNKTDYETSLLFDYENEMAYDRRQHGNKKEAVKSKFKKPQKETILQEGRVETIIGFPCLVSTAKIKGQMRELYSTKKIGLKFVKHFNTEGFLLKYSANDKYLGTYTVTAKNIHYTKLPESTYSQNGFIIRTPDEQKQYVEESKELRNENKQEAIDKIDEEAPKYSLRSIKGNKFKSKDIIGKIVVFNFWFTTCSPCKREIPQLNKLKSKYSEDDVVFIAVALDQEYKIEKFLRKHPFKYDIVEDGRWLASKFGVSLYPTNVIIDKNGNFKFFKSGFRSDITEAMSYKIDKLLNQ